MLSDYLIWLYEDRYSEWELTQKAPYLEMDLFADLGGQPLPLFFSGNLSGKETGTHPVITGIISSQIFVDFILASSLSP